MLTLKDLREQTDMDPQQAAKYFGIKTDLWEYWEKYSSKAPHLAILRLS